MRYMMDILRGIPLKSLKKATIKVGRQYGMYPGENVKKLYNDLLSECINKESDNVLLVYPYIDEALYAEKKENYKSENVVVLFLPELEEICDKGLDEYFSRLTIDIGNINFFLENPERINDDSIRVIRKHNEVLPNESFLCDFYWRELPSIKVYGYDKQSKNDLKIAASFMNELAFIADSKEDFEDSDSDDDILDILLGDEEDKESDTEPEGITDDDTSEDFEKEEEDDEALFEMLMQELEEDDEYEELTPEQRQRYRIAEITNLKSRYETVQKLLKEMYRK